MSRFNNRREKSPSQRFEEIMHEVKDLFNDKTHPDNRTVNYKKVKTDTLNRILTAANDMDEESEASGTYAMFVMMNGLLFALKDKVLEQDVEIKRLKAVIERYEKQ